jgi:hypothetical protein
MADTAQLERQRDDLERTPTVEDVSAAVDEFAETSARLFGSNAESYGLVLGGSGGDTSQRMQLAVSYIYQQPEFRAYLAAEVKKTAGTLTAADKRKQLKALDRKLESARAGAPLTPETKGRENSALLPVSAMSIRPQRSCQHGGGWAAGPLPWGCFAATPQKQDGRPASPSC